MILVRDIFELKFGKAREALGMMKEATTIFKRAELQPERFLTDVTGQYYTLVMESTYKNLADYEKTMQNETASEEWHKWYQKFVPLVESGRREIFNVLEPATM